MIKKLWSFIFSPSPSYTYELFTWRDGGRELWRIDARGKKYPETYFMKNWISDFGLSDYQFNKNHALTVSLKTEAEVLKILPTFLHWDEINFQNSLVKK